MDLLLQKLQQFFRDRSLQGYLVGGSLRDLLLDRRPQDLDLAVPGDPEQIARALADELKGHYTPLGLEKGVKRVILPKKPYSRLMIDVAPLHGASIADDLAQRDFTVNALALPLKDVATLTDLLAQQEQPPASLIDPFRGWYDLHARVVRVVQVNVFQHDPLRLLRAIRLCAHLQLSIEPATASLLRRDAPLLIHVAPERIRDELFQMLSLAHVIEAVHALDEYQLFTSIFPAFCSPATLAAPSGSLQASRSTWPTLTCMVKLLSASQGEAASLTQAEQHMLAPFLQLSSKPVFKKRWKKAPGRTYARLALLLLAALLSDLLFESTTADQQMQEQLLAVAAASRRLTLGRQATAFIVFLLQESADPWNVEPRLQGENSKLWRAARHYFERFGERGVDLATFRLARLMAISSEADTDHTWQSQTSVLLSLIEAYYYERNMLMPQPLIDGQIIIAHLGNIKGPLIGALLKQVRNAQLDGLIRTRAEALQFIAEQIAVSGRESTPQEWFILSQQNISPQKLPGE